MYVLSGEDIAPQKTSQRCAKRRAKCTKVDANRHAVHSCPECSIGDRDLVGSMDLFPFLYYTGEKNGGTDICARELVMRETV